MDGFAGSVVSIVSALLSLGKGSEYSFVIHLTADGFGSRHQILLKNILLWCCRSEKYVAVLKLANWVTVMPLIRKMYNKINVYSNNKIIFNHHVFIV